MRKKKLPFKKGMEVIWLGRYQGAITLTEGVVTMVTTRNDVPVVHVKHEYPHGYVYKRSFSPVAGTFQENPSPIWQLIPLDGKEPENMKKRAEHATRLFTEYQRKCDEIRGQVEGEARQWQGEEYQRRIKDVPNGPSYLQRVISRLGFKRPKNGVKVRVDGQVTTVK